MKGKFSNILCVLDSTHKQDDVIAQALHLAESHQATLTVHLALETLPANANLVMTAFAAIEDKQPIESIAQAWLDDAAKQWSKKVSVVTKLTIGEPVTDVIHTVIEGGFDLVLKRTDADLIGRLLGSTDMRLLRKCPCPVWLVHAHQPSQYKRVFAAIDVNYHHPDNEVALRKALNRSVLQHATEIALLEFAQLHIVHVYDVLPQNILRDGFVSIDEVQLADNLAAVRRERELEITQLLQELTADLPDQVMDFLQPEIHLVQGSARIDIAQTAKAYEADALVIGTVARLGMPGFIMGNTAEDVLNQLDCAVIALKPDGFVSPLHPTK